MKTNLVVWEILVLSDSIGKFMLRKLWDQSSTLRKRYTHSYVGDSLQRMGWI